MTQPAARLDEECVVGHAVGAIALSFKKDRPPIAIGTQKRFKLPGVGTVRVNIDKHVEQALKQQSHDIAKFIGHPKRTDRTE